MTSTVESGDRYRLRPGLYAAITGKGEVLVGHWPDWESLGVLDSGLRDVLDALAEKPHDIAELTAMCTPGDGELDTLLCRLRERGWLEHTVFLDGEPAYTLCPQRRPVDVVPVPAETAVLSRFALLRPEDGAMVLESPRSPYQVRIHDPRLLPALAGLAEGAATRGHPELPVRLRGHLNDCGFLVRAGAEREELRCAQWSPHELWFHTRSRFTGSGRVAAEHFGGTWWAEDRFPAPAARRDPFDGPAVALPRPDENRMLGGVGGVLEARATHRRQDHARPVSIAELGEFLYRCARVRGSGRSTKIDTTNRPYPSGGALYELETYLAVHTVDGLESGLYHYDPFDHRLTTVHPAHPATHRMLAVAQRHGAMTEPPQVLLVLAARFGRVMWKYETMGYALVLKNVGVLYQTMYTVGTAMGLATCALGAGDGEAFAAATGLDPMVEANVGEFVLGSLADDAGSAP